jgi:hypothetical protein
MISEAKILIFPADSEYFAVQFPIVRVKTPKFFYYVIGLHNLKVIKNRQNILI